MVVREPTGFLLLWQLPCCPKGLGEDVSYEARWRSLLSPEEGAAPSRDIAAGTLDHALGTLAEVARDPHHPWLALALEASLVTPSEARCADLHRLASDLSQWLTRRTAGHPTDRVDLDGVSVARLNADFIEWCAVRGLLARLPPWVHSSIRSAGPEEWGLWGFDARPGNHSVPAWLREIAKTFRLASLPARMVQALADTHNAAVSPDPVDGSHPLLRTGRPTGLAVIPGGLLCATPNATGLGTPLADMTVRWLARVAQGQPMPHAELRDGGNCVQINGGWQRLAESIGAGEDARKDLPGLLDRLFELSIDLDNGGRFRLLSGYVPPARSGMTGKSAPIVIWFGPLLFQGWAKRLGIPQGKRAFVPVLAPAQIESVGARSRGAAVRLDSLALVHLRMRMGQEGFDAAGNVIGVAVPWPTLADEAGLPRDLVPGLLAAWSDGRRWVELSPGRWMLGDADPEARNMIIEGGEMGRNGSELSRRQGRRKRQRLGMGK